MMCVMYIYDMYDVCVMHMECMCDVYDMYMILIQEKFKEVKFMP